MDHNKLRSLAGLPSLSNAEIKQLDEKLSDVKAKVEVPDGTFTKKAKSIVKTLVALHDGDKGKAMKALTFYINRAGKDVANAEELEKAKAILKEDVAFMEANLLRSRAGLPLLEKAESKDDESSDEPEDDVSAEEGKEKDEKSEEDDEDDLPSIVKKLAKKAVGKDEEALEDLLMKVYNAGFSDGQKAKEDESEEDKDSKKDNKKEPKDDLTKDNE